MNNYTVTHQKKMSRLRNEKADSCYDAADQQRVHDKSEFYLLLQIKLENTITPQ